MITIDDIANVLIRSKSATIFTHMRPDGDTLGSAMALRRALFVRGIKAEVVNEGPIPEKFSFLPGIDEIGRSPTLRGETYIAVDTSDPARLGRLEECFLAALKKRVTVNLDHHISNTRFAKYNYVAERPSNCENVLKLIEAMDVPLDPEMATYLMVGMCTDSGCFSHNDVDGDTFRAAAKVADAGANINRISYETMRRQSKARAQMYAAVIGNLRFFSEDTVAVALVSESILEQYRLDADATEGIVDFGLTIDGVEVSVCLLEVKKGQYKVSFRSKGKVDVNAVARTFGGGGHILASGCMLFGDIEEICDKLRYAIWQNAGTI